MEMHKRPVKKKMEESAESWAVSYADLLMVLMSFFIIFFSQNEKNGDYAINKIMVSLQKEFGAVQVDPATGKEIDTVSAQLLPGFSASKEQKIERKPSSLEQEFKMNNKLNLIISKLQRDPSESNEKQLYKQGFQIDFENNIYPLGSYEMNQKTIQDLKILLESLKTHREKVNLIFIGHTDMAPIKNKKQVVDNNMILSTLRASKAVEIAVKNGFSPYWVSAQGLAEFSRNTRSLSIRVIER
jgi:chemotaxis protein MotB